MLTLNTLVFLSKNWAYDTYTARSVNMGMPLTFSYNLNVFVLVTTKV